MAYLTAYLINGQKAYIDILVVTESDLGNNLPFKAEDNVSVGYEDISSPTNWHLYGTKAGVDYKYKRARIKEFYITQTDIVAVDTVNKTFTIEGDKTADLKAGDYVWVTGSTGNDGEYTIVADSTLSVGNTVVVINEAISSSVVDGQIEHSKFSLLATADKSIATLYFIANKRERDQLYTTEQQVGLGQLFHQSSSESRSLRCSKAISEVYNRLTFSQAQLVVNEVTSTQLFYNYIMFGIEGTAEGDDIEGLFDYLLSRPNTSYSATGLSSRNYIPVGYANATLLANALIDILKYGKY